MKHKKKILPLLIANWLAALLTTGVGAHAQSADTLIDKLVQKGILTVKEAEDLRGESDKDFTRAYSLKSGMPDWVTSMKFNGDFRGRFEKNGTDNTAPVFANDSTGLPKTGASDRNRFRYRARFGITATFVDDFEVGLRIASANPAAGGGNYGGNPVSANTDLSDGSSRKFVYFDAAYGKWTPIHTGSWTVSGTVGKMDNPFQISPMVFDADYQLEGAAIQAAWQINDAHALKFNGGGFILDEFNQPSTATPAAGRDPYLFGGQMLFESKWTPKIETSLGIMALNIANKQNLSHNLGTGALPFSNATLAAPNVNDGNTRDAFGNLLNNYNPIIGSGAFTYKLASFPFYQGEFPVKLAGEYMYNPGASTQNQGYWAGVTLGKAGHKGTWELSYKYQRLEADAWYEELVDDDNGAFYQAALPGSAFAPNATLPGAGYRGGTNVKGHVMKMTYSFTDAVSFTFTYYLTELIKPNPVGSVSASSHFMADLMWKF